MRTSARILFAAVAGLMLLLTLVPVAPVTQANAPIGPLDLSGELHGAPYRIRVPENWNGTLLVFAHGYRDKADHPGEIDNRTADIAPNAALEAPLWPRVSLSPVLPSKTTAGPSAMPSSTPRTSRSSSVARLRNPIARSSGRFQSEPSSRSRAWSSSTASSTARFVCVRWARSEERRVGKEWWCRWTLF